MEKEILFSVIVPIYKVEKYLPQCVESVLAQTYPRFELILVDDGSPDNCPHMCDNYAASDSRIKTIHKENGGLVSARQAGATQAQGDYVICVDGDDWVAPQCLQRFYEAIQETDADIVCCGYYEAYDDHNVARSVNMPSGLYDKERLVKEIYPCLIESRVGEYFSAQLWAKAFKRKIYLQQQLLVNTFVSVGEDHACTKPTVYYSNSLCIIEDHLYYYRQIVTSMTKSKKAFDWNGPKRIAQHFEQQIPMDEADFQNQVYRFVVHQLFNVCITQYNRPENKKTIKKDIRTNLLDNYYATAVARCNYKLFTKGWLARIALKYKIYGLMYIYNRYHHW